jgi:3-oxoacyl-[acyl-carrier protein] reductase
MGGGRGDQGVGPYPLGVALARIPGRVRLEGGYQLHTEGEDRAGGSGRDAGGPMTLTGLEGKVAVVTGAGRMRSIGRPIALALARAGCDVVITGTGRPRERYPDDEKAVGWRDIDSVADEIRALGRRALAVVTDVSDAAAVEELADDIFRQFGRVDVVINNASAARGADRVPVIALDLAEWHKVIAVNLHGTFYMSRTFGRRLVEQGRGGSIVNISSVGGKLMAGTTAAYAASKAGIHALTCAMADELGRNDIRVNAICPGIIDTFRLDDIPRGEPFDAMVRAQIPLGRAGSGDDVAWMAVYLCADQGSWISGQLYTVDGGMVRGR